MLLGSIMRKKIAYIFSFILILNFAFSSSLARVPITSDSRIKTLVYSNNEIFRIVAHYGYQTSIEFSANEQIETISVGQPHSWKITPLNNRLFIKALEGSAHTNMTLITNRRTYFFELESKDPDDMIDEELAYVVRFFYPDKNFNYQQLKRFSSNYIAPKLLEPARNPASEVISSAVVAENSANRKIESKNNDKTAPVNDPKINLNYALSGAENISPMKVFDDTERTYLQFPNNNSLLPFIFSIDDNGRENRLPYSREGKYIVLKQVFNKIILRLNNDEVTVHNENRL